MKTFLLILVLAVLAAVAIRVWLIGSDDTEQFAEISVATETSNVFDDSIVSLENIDDLAAPGVSSEKPDSDEPTNSVEPESQDAIPTITMSEFRDIRDVISALGLEPEQFMAHAHSWFRTQGMSMSFSGYATSADPRQPYEQYDEQTLVSFADSGDAIAQQILGERWHWSRPADSVAMLQRASEQGSSTAMLRLARFYENVTSMEGEELESRLSGEALAQVQAILDATPDPELEIARWSGAAEIVSGGWMPGPDQGKFTQDQQANLEMNPERQREICERALQTYEDMRDARAAEGKPPIKITAPPFIDKNDNSGYCDSPDWPRPDTSHCRLFKVVKPGADLNLFYGLCPPGD